MKKISFFLVSLFAAAIFSSEVSALPLFARQTGMVCSACHFQHFPMLNGFGRAFKSSGYTMMGMEGKVEGEGLTIPNTLNMAVLTSVGYEKSNQAGGTSSKKTTGDGAFYVPGTRGKLSLFFGASAQSLTPHELRSSRLVSPEACCSSWPSSSSPHRDWPSWVIERPNLLRSECVFCS